MSHLADLDPVALGLPRGGVPVAHEVARTLEAPLDVLIVRKLGVPGQPELAMGAIGEDGAEVLNEGLIRRLGLSPAHISAVTEAERAELARRARRYRGDQPPTDVTRRTVILIDDGLATGATARAGIEVLRERGAGHVVLAVPVSPAETLERLRHDADEVVCLEVPRRFWGVGGSYDDFSQVSDEEVMRFLAGP